MPNHKSAIKRVRQTKRRTLRNRIVRSSTRSTVKKVREAIAAGTKEQATAALLEATKALYSSASKGVIHRNAAARTVSRLTLQVNKLG